MNQTRRLQFERENLRAKMLRFSGFRAKVFLAPSAFARKPLCRWWPLLTCLRRNLGKSPSTPSQMVTNNHKWKTNGPTFDHGQFHDRIIILKLSLFGLNICRKIHIAISIFKVITKAWISHHDMILPHLYLDLHPITAKAHHAGPLAIELRQGAGLETKRFDVFFIVRSSTLYTLKKWCWQINFNWRVMNK